MRIGDQELGPGDTVVVTAHIFLSMVADKMRELANDPAAIKALADKIEKFADAIRRNEEQPSVLDMPDLG